MTQNNTTLLPETSLESAVQQFEYWRATRTKRGKIPDKLLSLVIPLMEKYRHQEIASALRLNYSQMKKYVMPFLSQDPQAPTTFVECSLPLQNTSSENCIIEFNRKNGAVVKISGTITQLQPLISILLES